MQGSENECKIKQLAILTTHPIQYNAPLFKNLATRGFVRIKVFYTWGVGVTVSKFDPGFGRNIKWDIPLLEGYEYEFLENESRFPGSDRFNGIINPQLVSRIKEWKADAILVFGWNFRSHLKALIYFKNKIPIFFRGDSTLLDEPTGFSFKKILRRQILKWVYRHVDYAFFVGVNNREYFKKHGLTDLQLIYAPHTIDIERFIEPDSFYKQEAIAMRRKLSIPDNSTVFLFAGKLERKKNVAFLLTVFMNISTANSHLIIVGNGILEKSLKEKSNDFNNIHFIDFQNQSRMPVIYRLCEVFVLPSQGPGETWGLAANEALACGCCLLMSDKCGGAVDLIRDNENGYVFESNNSQSLSDRIEKLINKKELRSMQNFSRQYVFKFSIERSSLAIEGAINSIRTP